MFSALLSTDGILVGQFWINLLYVSGRKSVDLNLDIADVYAKYIVFVILSCMFTALVIS